MTRAKSDLYDTNTDVERTILFDLPLRMVRLGLRENYIDEIENNTDRSCASARALFVDLAHMLRTGEYIDPRSAEKLADILEVLSDETKTTFKLRELVNLPTRGSQKRTFSDVESYYIFKTVGEYRKKRHPVSNREADNVTTYSAVKLAAIELGYNPEALEKYSADPDLEPLIEHYKYIGYPVKCDKHLTERQPSAVQLARKRWAKIASMLDTEFATHSVEGDDYRVSESVAREIYPLCPYLADEEYPERTLRNVLLRLSETSSRLIEDRYNEIRRILVEKSQRTFNHSDQPTADKFDSES